MNTQARSLELIVAANGDIPTVTSSHLKEIWNLLRRIPLNNNLDLRGSHEDSPTQPLTDAEYETLQLKFAQMCIDFTFKRFQQHVNSKFSQLASIDTNGLDESHPFINVKSSIVYEERGRIFRKARSDDKHRWNLFFVSLRSAQTAIQEFFDKGGFVTEDRSRI